MSPTIKEVAEAAQTSIKTVSRVVNQEPGVAPVMREKVRRIIAELGYVPNSSARRLKRGLAESFGLVLPRMESPYAMKVLNHVLVESSQAGYAVQVIAADPDLENDSQAIERIIRLRQVDGLLIAPPLRHCSRLIEELNRSKFPCVVITPNETDCVDNSVEATDRLGSAEATRYLLSLGHRRIAYITCGREFRFSVERTKGFVEEVVSQGLEAPERWIFEGDTTFESGYQNAQMILERAEAPLAILAGNDEMAVGVINHLMLNGYRVPQDVSVMGFDDMPIAKQVYPPLTTVCQPVDQIVQSAVRLLLRLIASRSPVEGEQIQVPTRLVIRGSCLPPRTA